MRGPANESLRIPIRILVVDDEEVVRTFVEGALRKAGYDIVAACSGEAALALARERPPFDVLLTDSIMPQMNGDESATLLRRSQPELTVIFLTGHSAQLFVPTSAMRSNDRFLEKPVTMRLLLETVAAALVGRADLPDGVGYT